MQPFKTPADTRILDCSRPLYHKGGTGKPGVLLIHGFTGSPHDMGYLFERLTQEGYTVRVPRLPGHGTNGEDFQSCRWTDWYRSASEALLELRSELEDSSSKIVIAGLSMGGIIAALLAAQFKADDLILHAPGFLFTPGSGASWLWASKFIAPFISSLGPSVEESTARMKDQKRRDHMGRPISGDRIILDNEYKYRSWIRQGNELMKMRRRAIRRLKDISCPVQIVVSRNDSTVHYSTGTFLKKRMHSALSVEIVELKDSEHIVVDDSEREIVADSLLGRLSRLHGTGTGRQRDAAAAGSRT